MGDKPTAVVMQAQAPLAVHADVQPIDMGALMRLAIDKGAEGVDALERLVPLAERMADRQAAMQFADAMARFHAECPPIKRRSENPQFTVTRNGVKKPSKYADLEDIATTIREVLGANGLAYAWTDAHVENDMLTLKCVVTHVGGHRREAPITFPVESRAGASPQQKYASTVTYAQRYSLIHVLGLTSCDDDDDGAGGTASFEKMSADQVETLTALADEVLTDNKWLLRLLGVEALADATEDQYEAAVASLEGKRKAKK